MGYIPLIAIIFGARQKTCEQAMLDLTMSVRSNSDFYNFDDCPIGIYIFNGKGSSLIFRKKSLPVLTVSAGPNPDFYIL